MPDTRHAAGPSAVRAEEYSVPENLTDDDLMDGGINPDDVLRLCPWAVSLTGHGGIRCWAAADLVPLFDAKGGNR